VSCVASYQRFLRGRNFCLPPGSPGRLNILQLQRPRTNTLLPSFSLCRVFLGGRENEKRAVGYFMVAKRYDPARASSLASCDL
jgi:hypothetical protein